MGNIVDQSQAMSSIDIAYEKDMDVSISCKW